MPAFPLNRGTIIAIILNILCKYSTNASIEKQYFFEQRFALIEENAQNTWVSALHQNGFIALTPNRNKNWCFFSAHWRKDSSVVEKKMKTKENTSLQNEIDFTRLLSFTNKR